MWLHHLEGGTVEPLLQPIAQALQEGSIKDGLRHLHDRVTVFVTQCLPGSAMARRKHHGAAIVHTAGGLGG
eukprot:11394227-Alexandrium_andersonii.AAC.1